MDCLPQRRRHGKDSDTARHGLACGRVSLSTAAAFAAASVSALLLAVQGCAPQEPSRQTASDTGRHAGEPRQAKAAPVAMLANLTHPSQLRALSIDTLAAHFLVTCHWLCQASATEGSAKAALERAREQNGSLDSVLAQETGETLLRALEALEGFGCLDSRGLEQLRQGAAPVIRIGPHSGSPVMITPIIPPSRAPELAAQLFNLQIRAATAHANASAPEQQQREQEQEQLNHARRWHWQELLSDQGYAAIIYAFPQR